MCIVVPLSLIVVEEIRKLLKVSTGEAPAPAQAAPAVARGLARTYQKGSDPWPRRRARRPTRPRRTSKGRAVATAAAAPDPDAKMKTKEYEREMRRLHGELVAMQEWVKATGAKVCIVFEGRDTAGKGGTIKRITERVSPRVFKVVALSAPTEREKSQMYVQRYVTALPRRRARS